MTLGEKIKKCRKEKGISVEALAKELGVSYTTVYRYENASIEKIPVNVFNQLCEILDVTPAQLMGNDSAAVSSTEDKSASLPGSFHNPNEAMEFMLKLPTFAAFGGYDPQNMSEEEIVEFANEILQQLKLVSYKYKR